MPLRYHASMSTPRPSLPRRLAAGSLRRLRRLLVGPRVARVGLRPRWRFRQPIHGGGGVGSLADLRGRHLLIRYIGLG